MGQGVRTRPVQVDICVDDFVSKSLLEELGLLKEESSKTIPPPARDIIMKHCSQSCIPKAIIALGPERGWTESEAKLFVDECGFESATLGSSILRVDTAAIVGVGIVSAALDDCASQTRVDESSKKRKW
jgi:RsmE family RNA methyltransferase